MRFLFRTSAVVVLLFLAFGARDAAAADPSVVWHGPRDDKVVALTFDDGWSTPRCQKISPKSWWPRTCRRPSFRTRSTSANRPLVVCRRRRAAAALRIHRDAGDPHHETHRDLTELLEHRPMYEQIGQVTMGIVERIAGVPVNPECCGRPSAPADNKRAIGGRRARSERRSPARSGPPGFRRNLLTSRSTPAVVERERNHLVIARAVPYHAGIGGRGVARPERQKQEPDDGGRAEQEPQGDQSKERFGWIDGPEVNLPGHHASRCPGDPWQRYLCRPLSARARAPLWLRASPGSPRGRVRRGQRRR